MAPVLDLLRAGLVLVIDEPAKLLDPTYDMFEVRGVSGDAGARARAPWRVVCRMMDFSLTGSRSVRACARARARGLDPLRRF